VSARRHGGVLDATVFTVAGVSILVGLGVWQLDRKTWKENLIATVTRLVRAPENLPARQTWGQVKQADDEYHRVTFSAEFLEGEEALVYTAGSAFRTDIHGAGYWVFAPARLAGGSIVIINRGFVPQNRKDPATRAEGLPHGTTDIVGVLRWSEARGTFTPNDEPQNNVWYARDVSAIAAAKKWDSAAPFYVEQEAPVPPGGLPSPGKLSLSLPDNHLQYAPTWFGLALGLAGVYVVWLAGHLRRRV
jgi:surfeit locus 1 family protein